MKSRYLPQDNEVETCQAAVISSRVRANFGQMALVFLAFHPGFFAQLLLEALPKWQEEAMKFIEKLASGAFSMQALESLLGKRPDSDFRSCLPMVIGTAYSESCDAPTLHLRFVKKRCPSFAR